ncbi:MAG: methyltransferase [Nitrososphaerota archaeon]|jgi:release factor glutamine methyltransferase|uniref:HemK2/MTQ2 family protein methyltransferase n=1 Tax=Candidatus Bathycorpusculum sp. TaxID=2994959 RepID=UPI002822FE0D|nr:class I SAM-dependent methyltransferase [Candidatus Termitimicrobium sp.]MCL2431384.1 class I SAM-dependent methyltransferase [Candidatus Termitimicrobium sp.]MDR0492064.1 methyltransferase [Nitrososphaerota archaeon]
MHYQTKRLSFSGFYFDIYEDVYEPAEDSSLFVENLPIVPDMHVLDLGTGCGILAVLAAKKGGEVIAVDLNPFAIRCAKQNAYLNDMRDRITFLRGDLFGALQHSVRFDLVLFNAPYLPSEPDEEATWIGRSWAGGADGRVVVDRFITEVSAYLKPAGKALLMQSTLTGLEKTLSGFNQQGLSACVVAERSLPFFETITLIEAKRLIVSK